MKEWYSTSGRDGIVMGVGVAVMFFGILRGCTGPGPAVDTVGTDQPNGHEESTSADEVDEVAKLVSLLADETEEKRVEAAEALGLLGAEAKSSVDELVATLPDEASKVRAAVATALPQVDPHGHSIAALVSAAETEEDSDVRTTMWTSAGLMSALWSADSEAADSNAAFPEDTLASLSGQSEKVTADDGSAILSGISSAEGTSATATAIAAGWLTNQSDKNIQGPALSLLNETSADDASATDAMISALRSTDASLQSELNTVLNDRELSDSQQNRMTLYQGLSSSNDAENSDALKKQLLPQAGSTVAQLVTEAQDSSSPDSLRSGALNLLRDLLTNADGDVSLENLPEDQREMAQSALTAVDFDTLNGPAAKADVATLVSYLGEHPQLNDQLLAAASSTDVRDDVRMEALRKLPKSAAPNIADQILNDLEVATQSAAQAEDIELRQQLQVEQLAALKKHGDASAVPKIAALMNEVEDPTLNVVAIETSVSLDPKSEAAAGLVDRALSAKDPQLVSMALGSAALLSSENASSVAPKVAALMSDANQRDAALNALSLQPEVAGGYSGDIAAAMADADDPKFHAAAMKMLGDNSEQLAKLPEEQSNKLVAALGNTLSGDDADLRTQSLGLLSQSNLLKENAAKYSGITDALTKLAAGDNKEARNNALQNLAAAGPLPENATTALTPLLSQTDDIDAAKLMLQSLNNSVGDDAEVQKNLALALSNEKIAKEASQLSETLGDRQVPVLAALATSEDETTQKSSLSVLSLLSQTDEGKKQLAAAQNSDDSNTTAIASLMLGELPKDLSDADQQKTLAAALSMPALDGQLSQLMSKLDSGSITPLSAIANDPEVSPETRLNAVKQLATQAGDDAKNNPGAVKALESVVASNEGRTGTESALALATVDPMSQPALKRLAADVSREIPGVDPGKVLASLNHMASSGNGDAVAALSSVITNDKLPQALKQKAFDAIMSQDHKLEPVRTALADLSKQNEGDFGNEAAMALIQVDPKSEAAANRLAQSITNSKDAKTAAKMMTALTKSAQTGSDQAINALADVTQSEKTPADIRANALTTIVDSESKSPAIQKALEAVAGDPKNESATTAAMALAKRDPTSAVAATQLAAAAVEEKSSVSPEELLSTLSRMSEKGNDAAPAAIAALATSKKTPAAVSQQAIDTLSKKKDSPAAVAAIEKIAGSNDAVGSQAAIALAAVDPGSEVAAQRLGAAISQGRSPADVQPMLDAVSSLDDSVRETALKTATEAAGQKSVTPTMLALAEKVGVNNPAAVELVSAAMTDKDEAVKDNALKLAKQMEGDSRQTVQTALWEQLKSDDKKSAAAALTELVDDADGLKKLTEASLKDPALAEQLPELLSRQSDGGAAALKEVLGSSEDGAISERARNQLKKMAETEAGKKQLEKLTNNDSPQMQQLIADVSPMKKPAPPSTALSESKPDKTSMPPESKEASAAPGNDPGPNNDNGTPSKNPEATSENKPTPETNPPAKAAEKPKAPSENKPKAKPEPEVKPTTQTPPASTTEDKPEPKPEKKPVAAPKETPAAKAEVISDAEPDGQATKQPEPKPAPKPEAKSKPDNTPAPKVEKEPAPESKPKSDATPEQTPKSPAASKTPPPAAVASESTPANATPPESAEVARSTSVEESRPTSEPASAAPMSTDSASAAAARTITVRGMQIVLNPGERLISVDGVSVSATHMSASTNSSTSTGCTLCSGSNCSSPQVCYSQCRVNKCRHSRCSKRSWKRCRIWRG